MKAVIPFNFLIGWNTAWLIKLIPFLATKSDMDTYRSTVYISDRKQCIFKI